MRFPQVGCLREFFTFRYCLSGKLFDFICFSVYHGKQQRKNSLLIRESMIITEERLSHVASVLSFEDLISIMSDKSDSFGRY